MKISLFIPKGHMRSANHILNAVEKNQFKKLTIKNPVQGMVIILRNAFGQEVTRPLYNFETFSFPLSPISAFSLAGGQEDELTKVEIEFS